MITKIAFLYQVQFFPTIQFLYTSETFSLLTFEREVWNILSYLLQRWSRGHKARGQGQGHKKNPRPRPRTALTKDTSATALQKKKKKKVFTKIFQAISKKKKKKVFTKIFQAISKKKKKKRSSQKFFKRSSQKNVFHKNFQVLLKNLTIQKIVLSSSRGQANFRGLEASRPRPRTSKCVLEDVLKAKDVLEDSTSDLLFQYCDCEFWWYQRKTREQF